MRRALGGLLAALALAWFQMPAASATTGSCPPSTAASGSRSTCSDQAAYDLLKARLGGDIAKALVAQHRLSAALDQDAADAQALSVQVTQEESLVADLESQVAQLDAQISDTQSRVNVEQQELAVVAKALYRQPDSFWMVLARTGNLHDALVAGNDLVVAGQRAQALRDRLEADLATLQADRQARQDELDREQGTLDLLVANVTALNDLISRQTDISSQLAALVTQIQRAQAGVEGLPPNLTAALAQLLEAQEQDLILRSYQQAWTQAQVGAGLAMVTHALPLGQTIHGLNLWWPMSSFVITQPFGPSSVLLEPPFGPYAHFHTGVDLAAPLGTSVMAAADGVVVAVGSSAIGYGNYVVIAHGGGIETLYGHLLDTTVTTGQLVVRGQQIGLEGSTGFSTGPHLHFELRINGAVTDPLPYMPLPGVNLHA